MTHLNSSARSKFAHLYLGTPGADPVPVFRDLQPDCLPDGTSWEEGAVFAVWFDGDRHPEKRTMGSPHVDVWEFFGEDGWPLNFPEDCKVPEPSFLREFQVFPYGWRAWRPASLVQTANIERRRPTGFATYRAQATIGASLAKRLSSPRTT